MESFVVYVQVRPIQPLSAETLSRIYAALLSYDEEPCVWVDDASGDLTASIEVAADDFDVAAENGLLHWAAGSLAAGAAGDVSQVVACTEAGQLVIEGAELRALWAAVTSSVDATRQLP